MASVAWPSCTHAPPRMRCVTRVRWAIRNACHGLARQAHSLTHVALSSPGAAAPAAEQEMGVRRLRDVEFCLPVCIGTVAWPLGKKVRTTCSTEHTGTWGRAQPGAQLALPVAEPFSRTQRTLACAPRGARQSTDYSTHKWTVYMRGPNNEDLTHILSKVQCLPRWRSRRPVCLAGWVRCTGRWCGQAPRTAYQDEVVFMRTDGRVKG